MSLKQLLIIIGQRTYGSSSHKRSATIYRWGGSVCGLEPPNLVSSHPAECILGAVAALSGRPKIVKHLFEASLIMLIGNPGVAVVVEPP